MSFVLETTPRFSVVCVARRQLTPAPPPLSEAEGNPKLYLRLRSLFAERGVAYSELFHEATLTSEASVEARIAGGWTDTTLSSGAKAMLMRRSKAKDGDASYALCVLAADRKLDWKRLKKHVAKDLRLATQEEVFDASRCLPGAVSSVSLLFALRGHHQRATTRTLPRRSRPSGASSSWRRQYAPSWTRPSPTASGSILTAASARGPFACASRPTSRSRRRRPSRSLRRPRPREKTTCAHPV
mmetsp:Transcript_38630/g.123833  ORF Transcript_38630/g.123833 Transcript_38630/m.123833 type:complete len:242 (+) Transcript_38630:70-795(+)